MSGGLPTLGGLIRQLQNAQLVNVLFAGSTSGTASLKAAAAAGTGTVITLPAVTSTLATLAGTETLTNKTLTSPTITGGTSTQTLTGIGATIGGVASGSYSQASNTVLANVTGMAATLVAGATYTIDGYLATTNNGTGGIKLQFAGGGATATLLLVDTWVYNTTTLTGEVNITALASPLVGSAIAATAVFFGGTITVNAGGVLQLQAAQQVSNGTPLTIANGSFITFTRIA